MYRGNRIILVVALTAACIAVYIVTSTSWSTLCFQRVDNQTAASLKQSDERQATHRASDSTQLAEELQKLSRQINSLQEKYQQLACKMKNQAKTSETGGWCDNAVKTLHSNDQQLIHGLKELFKGQSVVGLGDGRGYYREQLLQMGAVSRYDAFDGAPNINETTKGQVGFIDLTLPQYWLPKYDWVMCLEVLEHIPAEYESMALDNLARAARTGVVLSWAVLGQGGFKHVNCRPAEHVVAVMMERGFEEDIEYSKNLRQLTQLWWLKKNIKVFRRKV